MRIRLCALALAILLPTTARCEGPSLDDTISWIENTLNNPDCLSGNQWQKQRIENISLGSDGDVELRYAFLSTSDNVTLHEYADSFNIRDIDSIGAEDSVVDLFCADDEYCVRHHSSSGNAKRHLASLGICSKNARVKQAFEHYQELVGGQRKSQEPF